MTRLEDVSHIDHDALEAALRASVPNVLLAPPWLLQAIIAHDLGLMPTGLAVPDDQLHIIDREKFVRFIEDQELPKPADPLPEEPELILLERPDGDWLANTSTQHVLLRFWRLLTRAVTEARVRRALPDPASPAGTEALRRALDERIDRIGRGIMNEARQILVRERRLHGERELDAYTKFAAAFTELNHFAPRVLQHMFPSISDPGAVAAVLAEDIGTDVVQRVRPQGAEDPPEDAYQAMEPEASRGGWWATALRWLFPKSHGIVRKRGDGRRPPRPIRDRLVAAAERAADLGNHVRAAILKARAFRDRDDIRIAPGQAGRELDRLAERLQAAIGFDEETTAEWRDALRTLLGPASHGWWSAESRLLYDLQKVCVDFEREIYSVNVVEWILELGRRKLVRPLPNQRLSLGARHLQSAVHRLPRCRLSAPQRARLERLLEQAEHEMDHRLRRVLGPRIVASLDAAGMVPRNSVEAVGRDKIVQEMLDVILDDGYLTFAGVRDTISRNVLRCKDMDQVSEWLGYDQLMQLDRRLGDALDGVYHRGEIYRYLFQKLSSILFANPAGRVLTKTVILPIAGAYLILEAIGHTVGLLMEKVWHKHLHLLPAWKTPDEEKEWEAYQNFDFNTLYNNPKNFIPWIVTALLILALVNSPAFRRGIARVLGFVFRWITFLLLELPELLLKTRIVQALMNSRPLRLVFRYGVKPLLFVLLAWWILPNRSPPIVRGLTFGGVFMLVNLLVNSRTGRAIEQSIIHALRVGWIRFTAEVLNHAIHAIVRFFERMVEAVDRMLYAVDEWLRFRSGQRKRSFLGKAFLSVLWFYVAYVARFAINLLVEPQINPVKHFPVVTVSHKLLLPLAFTKNLDAIPSPLGQIFADVFRMQLPTANRTAAGLVWLIPGVFGFLAWELKENWKLYRANLPKYLRPVHFGSHGESVAQLLRPGFHSGTLPKAYAKVRRAHRNYDPLQEKVDPTEFPLSVRKHLGAVHHVQESLEHFIERAFLALVNRHPRFEHSPLMLTDVKLGATRLTLAFDRVGGAASAGPLRVEIEQVYGWIVADVVSAGWSAELQGEAAELLAFGLRGLFKMSAVEIVRSDIDAAFSPRRVTWELQPKFLAVRPVDAPLVEVEYALYEREMRPRLAAGAPEVTMPTLAAEHILFSEREIPWSQWVVAWSATSDKQALAAQPTNGKAASQVPAKVIERPTAPVS